MVAIETLVLFLLATALRDERENNLKLLTVLIFLMKLKKFNWAQSSQNNLVIQIDNLSIVIHRGGVITFRLDGKGVSDGKGISFLESKVNNIL